MRGLLCFGAIVVVLVVAFVLYRGANALTGARPAPLLTGGGQAPPGGRWFMRHYAETGHTVVTVARMASGGEVLEEHVIDRIHDSDADWSRRFLLAKQEAEERAFHLNADL